MQNGSDDGENFATQKWSDEDRSPGSGLKLVVLGEASATILDLPPAGALVIGRSNEADVKIDHPSISRRHARLHLGPPLAVEDLGSQNGTRVDGRALGRGERTGIAPGALVDLGSVMIVVQPTRRPDASAICAPVTSPVVDDAAMQRLHRLAERIAPSPISVLILGETGVGKEVLAEKIHRASPRATKPLLRLNCAALSETLLESELFGHEKGAFTGAAEAKPGLLETADGGTVFLDEVGELPLKLQVKLLRVLEDRQVLRVGGTRPRAIDVRFLAATNRDLEGEAAAGRFRLDLFYRLAGIVLTVPPLRERVGEIASLARLFIERAARQAGRPPPRLSAPALAELERRRWPGNVRELRNLLERAVLLCDGDAIGPEHLASEKGISTETPNRSPEAEPTSPIALWGQLEELERQRIVEALERCAGNQTQAAKLLGISRGTLLGRLQTYGIPRPRKPNT